MTIKTIETGIALKSADQSIPFQIYLGLRKVQAFMTMPKVVVSLISICKFWASKIKIIETGIAL